MENGKKQNVETVQSTGDRGNLRAAESKFRDNNIFRCMHPNSSECVDFRVEPRNTEQSLNGHFHYLFYDSDYIVHKHNLENKHVLTHKKFEKTLQEWLDENGNNWCETYRGWGVNRPKEDARKIIQGILIAVYKLHQNDSFHGFLHHLENFTMDFDELVIGGDHKEIIHISLIHSKVECYQNICLSKDCDLEQGKRNDIQAMSRVIFDQILGGNASYPPDLEDLYSMLKMDSINWELVVNHPSLWHWKSRFSYIGQVWMYYRHANPNTKAIMDDEFKYIDVKQWKDNIRPNTTLEKICKPGKYGSTTIELIRCLRNARFHYKDLNQVTGKYRHFDLTREPNYQKEKFIELKTSWIAGDSTTGTARDFLAELYDRMRKLEIRFEI